MVLAVAVEAVPDRICHMLAVPAALTAAVASARVAATMHWQLYTESRGDPAEIRDAISNAETDRRFRRTNCMLQHLADLIHRMPQQQAASLADLDPAAAW